MSYYPHDVYLSVRMFLTAKLLFAFIPLLLLKFTFWWLFELLLQNSIKIIYSDVQ